MFIIETGKQSKHLILKKKIFWSDERFILVGSSRMQECVNDINNVRNKSNFWNYIFWLRLSCFQENFAIGNSNLIECDS